MSITKKLRIDMGDLEQQLCILQDELDSLSSTELGYLDAVTAGTMEASKVLVADSSNLLLAGGIKCAPVAVPNGASYAALVANSGHLHATADQGQTLTVTLPAAASGLTFEFTYGGAAADASSHIFVPTAGVFKGSVEFHDSQADATTPVFANGSSNDVFTLVTPAAYNVKFVSNGTDWYVTGWVGSATVCTMADS